MNWILFFMSAYCLSATACASARSCSDSVIFASVSEILSWISSMEEPISPRSEFISPMDASSFFFASSSASALSCASCCFCFISSMDSLVSLLPVSAAPAGIAAVATAMHTAVDKQIVFIIWCFAIMFPYFSHCFQLFSDRFILIIADCTNPFNMNAYCSPCFLYFHTLFFNPHYVKIVFI